MKETLAVKKIGTGGIPIYILTPEGETEKWKREFRKEKEKPLTNFINYN